MATKGTYGAYGSQAQASGEFAGASQFARMAGVTAQKKAEERAEQKQLRDEARESIRLAIDASNVDLSQIESSVHTGVGKMLDSYAERMTDLVEAMDTDYSFDKQMELSKLKSQFQSNVTAMAAIGANNKYVTSGEWDNLMSTEAVNGNTRFMMELPQILEKMDPATMTVDGKRIDAVYRDYVDFSKLVAPIDSEGLMDSMAVRLMDNAEKIYEFQGREKVGYDVFKYNDAEVRELYNTQFSGTQEYKKTTISLLAQYDATPDDQKSAFQYVTLDEDGEAYVSDSDVFRYFRDTKLPERIARSREELPPEKPSETELKRRLGAAETQLQKKRTLEDIDEAFNASGVVHLKGEHLTVGASKVQIKQANRFYDFLTGEDKVGLWYDKTDGAKSVTTGLRTFSTDMTGRQEMGNQIFGDKVDYLRDAEEIGHVPVYEPLDFGGRNESIQYQSNIITDNLVAVYNQSREENTPRKHEDAVDRMVEQLAEFGLDSQYIRAFIKDNSKKTGWGPMSKPGMFGSDYLGDTKDQQTRAAAMTFGAMYAKSLEADGVSAEQIRKDVSGKVKEFIDKGGKTVDDFGYEFDAVVRHIKSTAGSQEKEREMMREAYNYKRDMGLQNKPVSDKDLIRHLNSGKTTETNPQNMAPKKLREQITALGYTESKINNAVAAVREARGVSEEEALRLVHLNIIRSR